MNIECIVSKRTNLSNAFKADYSSANIRKNNQFSATLFGVQ